MEEKELFQINEEKFNEEIFKQRYDMIKKMQIRDAVSKYKSEAAKDDQYYVLKSNVRDDKKSKDLYSVAGTFKNWKDAEQFKQTVGHSIIVDSETSSEVTAK